MREPFRIGDQEIAAGTACTVELPIARRYTADDVHLSVRVVHGREPGPCLFLTAAIHGDEINGVEVVHRVVHSPRMRRLRGTLLAIPVVNIYGFLQQNRYLPDRRDLNRCFPGSAGGSLAARLAYTLESEVVAHADAGIDLHTGSLHRSNLPQIRGFFEDPEVRRLADAFGAPVMLDSPPREGSLRGMCAERNVPLVVYEAGQALRFDKLAIGAGVRGVFSVLQELGMLRHTKGSKRKPASLLARSSSWVRAPGSGVLRAATDLGARVAKGQRLAMLAGPLGEEPIEVSSPCDGIVVGAIQLPLVNEGDALYHVARFQQLDAVSDRIDNLVEELADTDFAVEPAEGEIS